MFGLRAFDETGFCGAGEEPAGDEEQRAEGEETAVVEPCVVGAFADVVDREDLVIDDPFNKVEQAPAEQQPPEKGSAADSRSPVRGAPPENPTPTATAIQATAWKRPSQSVFVSSPATVVLG